MTWSLRLTSILAAAVIAVPALAQESGSSSDPFRGQGALFDASTHTRAPDITVYGNFAWFYGIGIGARYSHPLLADGFIDGVNDELRLDVGGDFFPLIAFTPGYIAFDIGGGPRYVLHITEAFDLYLRAEIGYLFQNYYVDRWPLYLDFVPGLSYQVTPNFKLRLEAGYHATRVGFVWAF